ncbi:hypothetical protein JTB14_029105 [Gonioctena quinquepunctata]|nr:hypothetical protein JTB14_029105 [Gonioctena quinquepunctata]
MVRKWISQQDVLRHRNVKLFITHGGLLSLQEAITNDMPVIGIAFGNDQLSNINRVVTNGWGIELKRKMANKGAFISAVNEVLDNPKYREKARLLGEIYRDEETSSLKKAIYWTEYVIKYKGAPHLKSPAHAMPFWKYHLLDVYAFSITVLLILFYLGFLVLKCVFKITSFLYSKWMSKEKVH